MASMRDGNRKQVDAEVSPDAGQGGVSESDRGQPEIEWDHQNMVTTFANVVNIQSSPEQLELCFGTNHSWNLSGERQVKVELTNRIIMNPLAAKRLLDALERVIREHESRYGTMSQNA